MIRLLTRPNYASQSNSAGDTVFPLYRQVSPRLLRRYVPALALFRQANLISLERAAFPSERTNTGLARSILKGSSRRGAVCHGIILWLEKTPGD